MKTYQVARAGRRPALQGLWDGPVWGGVEPLAIDSFRPESSDHRPRCAAKVIYDDEALYGIFRVDDRYVRAVHTNFQDDVCRDSCVECFVQPDPTRGHFNFEFNCGGTLLCSYVKKPPLTPEELGPYIAFSDDACRRVGIYHSLPAVVDPELTQPTQWSLEFAVPFALLEGYGCDVPLGPGATWHANFYKCGDATSHPHWAAWSPVDELNFHLPRCFGKLEFM